MDIGKAIKFNRQLRGLTLDELANNLNNIYEDENFTKSKLSKWERNLEIPRLTSFKRVAEYFDSTMDEMIKLTDSDKDLRDKVIYKRYSDELNFYGLYTELEDGVVNIYEAPHQFVISFDFDDFVSLDPQELLNYNLHKDDDYDSSFYDYFDIGISAGKLESVEYREYASEKLQISDSIMGKYARRDNIIFLRINGDSMNKVIPDYSLIAVDTSKKEVNDVNNNDIVVFSDNGEYSVKRYFHDKENKRFLFKPDSWNELFTAIEIKYENATNLRLIGKVVKYIVELD